MVQTHWQPAPLTKEQADDLFMLFLEDDTEEAPWMVMGDLQFWSASAFAHSLRIYARRQRLPWYVASMLPITYRWGKRKRQQVLAPDTFVAFAPDHPRTSFDVAVEGGFPPFVLEVVSPSSVERDREEKREAYELLGVREYALFTPRAEGGSLLQGYQRDETGLFSTWHPDEQGRLWSEVLGLYLVVRGQLLQAQTPDGRLLLTPEQEGDARERAEEARQRAEAEAEQLRRELDRLRSQGNS
jgi:Uma2 family endonuclease